MIIFFSFLTRLLDPYNKKSIQLTLNEGQFYTMTYAIVLAKEVAFVEYILPYVHYM